MPETKSTLKPKEVSKVPRVQRSGYFIAPDGGAVVEVNLGNYLAFMPVDVAEETAKRLQRAVDRIRNA